MKITVVFILFYLSFTLISCEKKHDLSLNNKVKKSNIPEKKTDSLSDKAFLLEETFADSLNIGDKGKNKVVIQKFGNDYDDDDFVLIKFFNLNNDFTYNKNKWNFTNKFIFEKDNITGLDILIRDFNNDGFKDFTYLSENSGRGGNEIRNLFVYNPKYKDFTYIKNSENYPNLEYNKDLDCINSTVLTGSTSTYFLKIKKDTLYDFAKINVYDSIIVKERDKKGKYRILLKRKLKKDDSASYSSYKDVR